MYKIIILLVIIVIIYYLFSFRREGFTALSGLNSPLATYDDLGTFNFIFHHNDLPYYDNSYDHMCRSFENYTKCTDPIEFIKYDGNNKLRRKLRGSNYYLPPLEDKHKEALWDPLRPRGAVNPPQPSNWYF